MIPKTFDREKYLKLGEKSSFFGIPITELTFDELVCMIGFIGEEIKESQKNHQRLINFYKGISS